MKADPPDRATEALPWLAGPDDALLLAGADAIARGAFRQRVRALAARLPQAPFAINLCERRDHFILGFCAALLRGQVTLLPPSRATAVVDEVAARHPGSYRLIDTDDGSLDGLRVDDASAAATQPPTQWPDEAIPAGRLAMIGFTSGSTGEPAANPKTWGSLRLTNAANMRALHDMSGAQAISIVATVPPQHMYGMEMSVLLPLLGPFAVHPGRPFFPQDVANALREVAPPRLLVTTPVHLRALLEAGVELPPLAAVVTATAPLPVDMAALAEARYGCEVRELFGSTETCVIARRRTATETAWRLYDDVCLNPQAQGTRVERPALPMPVWLADQLELVDGGRGFMLRGRQADLLEIAGKRASLGDLTRRLQAVPGVHDGVIVQSDVGDAGIRRLAAIIVADPELKDSVIIEALRQAADPVFLPRRIIRLDRLPRNETGKLPKAAVDALLGRP